MQLVSLEFNATTLPYKLLRVHQKTHGLAESARVGLVHGRTGAELVGDVALDEQGVRDCDVLFVVYHTHNSSSPSRSGNRLSTSTAGGSNSGSNSLKTSKEERSLKKSSSPQSNLSPNQQSGTRMRRSSAGALPGIRLTAGPLQVERWTLGVRNSVLAFLGRSGE